MGSTCLLLTFRVENSGGKRKKIPTSLIKNPTARPFLHNLRRSTRIPAVTDLEKNRFICDAIDANALIFRWQITSHSVSFRKMLVFSRKNHPLLTPDFHLISLPFNIARLPPDLWQVYKSVCYFRATGRIFHNKLHRTISTRTALVLGNFLIFRHVTGIAKLMILKMLPRISVLRKISVVPTVNVMPLGRQFHQWRNRAFYQKTI